MSARRYVFLDPDGSGGDTWMYVVVEAPTGVYYQQQYGGTACRQGEVEGFLVPVAAEDALKALRRLFEQDFRGAGTRNHVWTDAEWERLRQIVGTIPYWASDGQAEEPYDLRLDDDRADEADEAWVPVLTPDGPGVLLWCNSD